METIHILHTNDIHSHFEYWPQIHRLLLNKREEYEKCGEPVFLFDIGDHVDRSHPFTEGTSGKGNIQLLNAAQYDAVTIGNNEGITMAKAALNELYEDAQFDIVVGNLHDVNNEIPEWAIPSTIYKTPSGTRIGVLGATAYYNQFYETLGWNIIPSREQLIVEAKTLAAHTDLIICLSHLGLPEDRLLAQECTEIDLILGAHTHHLLPEGELVNHSLLAATGKFGDFVGHVTLQYDKKAKCLIDKHAQLYRSADLPVDDADIKQLNDFLDVGKKALDEKLFYNQTDLKQNLFAPSDLSSFFGRALIDYTGADCALFNAGIFLGSLDEGWVTKGDMHRVLPHPINVCTIQLSGAELLEVYEQSLNEELAHIEVKGLGFRGTLMGALIHERLFMNRWGTLFAGNQEVVPHQIYTLATLDMFTFGFFFPQFKDSQKEYLMPDLIRDVLAKYGQKNDESTTLP